MKFVECDPNAMRVFEKSLSNITTHRGLMEAAIAISMHAFDDVDLKKVMGELDRLVERTRRRLTSYSRSGILAQLHEVLFVEEGFQGNDDRFFDVLNCLVPCILHTKQGIPTSLGLIYKYIASELGLEVDGIVSPTQLLLIVKDNDGFNVIDPFDGGRSLDLNAFISRVVKPNHEKLNRLPNESVLQHPEWLARMLRNICCSLEAQNRRHDMQAMFEMLSMLREKFSVSE